MVTANSKLAARTAHPATDARRVHLGTDEAARAAVGQEQGADFVTVGTGAILHHDFAARALADPAFRVRERPVSREDLRAESVGEAFLDYLAAGWDDLVA